MKFSFWVNQPRLDLPSDLFVDIFEILEVRFSNQGLGRLDIVR
jgi:hypothetical protein